MECPPRVKSVRALRFELWCSLGPKGRLTWAPTPLLQAREATPPLLPEQTQVGGEYMGHGGHHTKAQTLPWKFLVLHSLIVSRVGDPQGMKIPASGLENGDLVVSPRAARARSTIKPRLPFLFTPSLLLKPGPKLIKTKLKKHYLGNDKIAKIFFSSLILLFCLHLVLQGSAKVTGYCGNQS